MLLDVKDRKILYVLDKNSRSPDSAIAKKTAMSKQVVNYRIKNLVKTGVIKQFQSTINLAKLGLTVFAVYFRIQNANHKRVEEIKKFLNENKHVLYLASLGGSYDLGVVVPARNVWDFDKILSQLISEYPENLSNYDIAIKINIFKYNKSYLVGEKQESQTTSFGGEPKPVEIDETDRMILEELSTNSRMTTLELGRKTKIPASTIASRIKKLTEKGVIQNFSLFMNQNKFGYKKYKTLIALHRTTKNLKEKIFGFCEMHPNITWAIKTIGKWELEIRSEVKDQEEYQRLLIDMRALFGNEIKDLESLTIFEEIKEDFSIALNYF